MQNATNNFAAKLFKTLSNSRGTALMEKGIVDEESLRKAIETGKILHFNSIGKTAAKKLAEAFGFPAPQYKGKRMSQRIATGYDVDLAEKLLADARPFAGQFKFYVGIYLLKKCGSVVYVGQSANVLSRLSAHVDSKEFDSADIVPLAEFPCGTTLSPTLLLSFQSKLDLYETTLIRHLKPLCNQRDY